MEFVVSLGALQQMYTELAIRNFVNICRTNFLLLRPLSTSTSYLVRLNFGLRHITPVIYSMLHTARLHVIFISVFNSASRVLLSIVVYNNQVETLSLNHDVLYSTVTMAVAGALYSYQLTINVAFKTHPVLSIKK